MVLTTAKHFETVASKDPAKLLISEEMQGFIKKAGKSDAWLVISGNGVVADEMKLLDGLQGVPYPALVAF